MSTTMPPAATAWKMREQSPGGPADSKHRDPSLVGRQQHVADHDVLHAGQLLRQGRQIAAAASGAGPRWKAESGG